MDNLPAFLALGAQALLPIALGSFKSLRTPAAVRKRRRAARKLSGKLYSGADDELDDEDLEVDDEMDEVLTMADSVWFPVLGSVALLGLWFVIRYIEKKWIDLVFGVYFSGAGMFAVHSTAESVIDGVLRLLGARGPVYHVRVSSGIKQIFHLPLRRASFLAMLPATALPLAYVPLGRPYFLSNALALCLATTALALLRLDGFPTAALLLSLLLVYDIFWVFYTPVMVTVAKGLDAPIKLLAPKPNADAGSYAMLGLGDVVVPGLLVALCLRFDMARAAAAAPTEDITPRSSFPKPYFYTALVAYVSGLVATVYAMSVTGAAQPALLYLSPACVLAPLLLAVARGELGLLWAWREEGASDDEDERDETIEAPSLVAQMARAEAKARDAADESEPASAGAGEAPAGLVEPQPLAPVVDESWMDNAGVATGTAEGKKPRRRGGKKK